MPVTDGQLMRRLAAGDQQAFALLMHQHAQRVLNVLYRIVLSREEAEDLCQEVFEKLWLQAPHWQDKAQVSTWLYRVAHNAALNHRQRFQARHLVDTDEAVRASDDQIEQSESAGEQRDQAQRQQRIESALAGLPEAQRAAVVFRYYQGLPVKDIAEIMETSPKAVESLLSRAKPQLKARLGGVLDAL